MGAYVYRLYLKDGSDVGTFTTVAWDWEIGQTLFDGQHREWRILGIVPVENQDIRGLFTVEPVRMTEAT